jgi:hypothetical protein
MTVAYLAVADDRVKLFNIFNDPAPFLSADPFFFLLTAVLVLTFGPGTISVDQLVAKWLGNKFPTKGTISSETRLKRLSKHNIVCARVRKEPKSDVRRKVSAKIDTSQAQTGVTSG